MTTLIRSLFSGEHPLILASKSPQRSRILEMFDVPFRAVDSEFEEVIEAGSAPEEAAELLAQGKAQKVSEKFPSSIVVGVDTIVVSAQGEILEKPKDREDARRMLLGKSGQKETVISGICLITAGKTFVHHEKAEIHFSKFSENDIEWMLDLNEWQGKSGAISVEGKSSIYIDRIDGNFWNIVGFPIPTFLKMLQKIAI